MFRALLAASMLVVVAVPNAHADDVCVRVSTTGTVLGTHSTGWICGASPFATGSGEVVVTESPEAEVIVEYYVP